MLPVHEIDHQAPLLWIAALISADLLAGGSLATLLSSAQRRLEVSASREYRELCHAVLAGRFGNLTAGGGTPLGGSLTPWLLPVDAGLLPRRVPNTCIDVPSADLYARRRWPP